MSSPDWDEKVTWMRRVRASDACFATSGQLISVKLETLPPEADQTQHDTPEQVRAREIDNRRRISLAATSGIVPRAPRSE